MDKILLIVNRMVVAALCNNKDVYSVEIKQGEENYLLINSIKGDIIYCNEWSGTKYRKECEFNISDLDKYSLEITQNKKEGTVIYKGVKDFLIQKSIELAKLLVIKAVAFISKIKYFIGGINFKRIKNIDLGNLKNMPKDISVEQIKYYCSTFYKNYQKSRYNERLSVLNFAVEKSLNETLHEFDFDAVSKALSEFISPDRLKMILDYFVESGDLSKDKYSELYIINGKALQTLDRLKQTEQLVNLNLYLRIIAVLLLLILIF